MHEKDGVCAQVCVCVRERPLCVHECVCVYDRASDYVCVCVCIVCICERACVCVCVFVYAHAQGSGSAAQDSLELTVHTAQVQIHCCPLGSVSSVELTGTSHYAQQISILL